MKFWINNIHRNSIEKKILNLDSDNSLIYPEPIKRFEEFNTYVLVIPKGMTSYLQPLDNMVITEF